MSRTLNNIFGYTIFFIASVMTFNLFHFPTTSLLAGAGIIGLAVGFGAQGLVSDIVTGFFVLLGDQIDVDDYITIGNFSGIVEQVGLRITKIRGFNGALHYIPNRKSARFPITCAETCAL